MHLNPLVPALTAIALLTSPSSSQDEPKWSIVETDRHSVRWWSWDSGVFKPVQVAAITDSLAYDPADDPLERRGRWSPPGGWAVLDTFRPLHAGDRTIPAGRWYVAFERQEDQLHLLLMAPDQVHERRLSPTDLSRCPIARSLPMDAITDDRTSERFAIFFDEQDHDHFRIRAQFGPHAFGLPVRIELDAASPPIPVQQRIGAGGAGSGVPRGTPRRALRAFMGAGDEQSFVQLSYNPVPWVAPRPSSEVRRANDMSGRSWRLGKNFWTVLTNDVPLRRGDVEIPPGVWYVGIHRSRDGETWQLSLFDPARVRELLIDSNWISIAPPTMRIGLDYREAEKSVDVLEIEMTERASKLRFHIAWGPHRLSGEFTPVTELLPVYPEYWALMWEGSQTLKRGYYDQAVSIFELLAETQPERAHTCYYNVACAQSLKGDIGQALASLERAIDHGFANMQHMRVDSDLAAVRMDPRFKALLDR